MSRLQAREVAKPRPEFDRYPDHLPAKVTTTPSGIPVQYELPFRKTKSSIGLVVISVVNPKQPTIAIWEIAGEM